MSDEEDLKNVPPDISEQQVEKVCLLIRARGDAFAKWMQIAIKAIEAKREVDLATFELERQVEFMRRVKP